MSICVYLSLTIYFYPFLVLEASRKPKKCYSEEICWSDRNEFNQMRLWGLFQFGRDSMFYCRTEFSVDRQPGEKRKIHVFCSWLLVHGRTRFLWSPCLPGVGEIFLVILPTGQCVIKWLDVSEQLKYHTKKQLIQLNHFWFFLIPHPISEFTKWKSMILASAS